MWDSFEEFNNGGFLVHRNRQGVKIRIVLAGLRGEGTISVLYRREGISESLYYSWSEEFLEAGKRRLSGDMARLSVVRSFGTTFGLN